MGSQKELLGDQEENKRKIEEYLLSKGGGRCRICGEVFPKEDMFGDEVCKEHADEAFENH